MADKGDKKKPSGAEFRKRAAQKQAQQENFLKKVPKINKYFTSFPESESPPKKLNQSDHVEEISSEINVENTVFSPPSSSFTDKPTSTSVIYPLSLSCADSIPQGQEPITNTEIVKSYKIDKSFEFHLNDAATWDVKNDDHVKKVVQSNLKQDLTADFSKSERCYKDVKNTRRLSVNLFSGLLPNGEVFKRDWLLYSKSTGRVFCVPCLLFQPENKRSSFSEGFNDWKHSFELTKLHEKSNDHRVNVLKLISRKKFDSVDALVVTQHEKEVKYWREVLTRVISVVKFLAARGLPFRGDNQQLGSTSNGLFLGCLELISEFDPFFAQHLETYGNKGKGNVSYLSSDTCSEFISIMSKQVLNEITKEIKEARYFSLIIDSTPDTSRSDQLAVVLRYVSLSDASACERLIRLLPGASHKAEGLEEATLSLLDELNLDVGNCRGQSYDNASNMSGMYSGLQSRIRAKNELADYVPCAAHSLNLVGVYAAEKSCAEAVIFFTFVQSLYTFFSSSTHRWDLLKSYVRKSNEGKKQNEKRTLMLQSLSETRWSARADAVRALVTSHKEIKEALDDLIKDQTQTPETRLSAQGFRKTMDHFPTVFITIIWSDVLQRVNKVSETLQKEELDLLGATKELETLSVFLKTKSGDFDQYEVEALKVAGLTDPSYDRTRKKTIFTDEKRDKEYENMNPRDKFRCGVFKPILDHLAVQLDKRKDKYKLLSERFEIFSSLHEKQNEDIKTQAQRVAQWCSNDIDKEDFVQECLHFKFYMDAEKITRIRECYAFIKKRSLESTFPNLEIAIRIYLTLPVTNCTAERSFSALKRIKTENRSTMEDEKLNSLMLLCTQNDITLKLDFAEIIDSFAKAKTRKKAMI